MDDYIHEEEMENADAQKSPRITSDIYPFWAFPEIDESMSVKQCISGAKKGNADAQIELALRYYEGKDVEKNEEKAIEFVVNSASQGNGKALYFLAYLEEKSHCILFGIHVLCFCEYHFVLAQV